jgi:spermidine/putrescine transport system substrate-binding protein
VNEKVLNFANWTDYIADDTIPGFTAQTGIAVTYDNYTSNDELAAKLAGGQAGYDLVVPSENLLRKLIAGGTLMPLDHDLLPNLPNVDSRFREADYDEGNRYAIPWAWGTTGLAYDKRVVTGPVTGFEVFGVRQVRGRASILDEARDGLAMGLLATGHDPNSLEPADLDQAVRYLLDLKHRRQIAQFTSETVEPMGSGQLPLAQCYSGDAAQAAQNNPDLVYLIPKEGGMTWVDTAVIPAQAPHALNAHSFLNFVLRPEVAAKLANTIRYGSPNAAARPMIDKALLDDPLVYPPPEVLAKLPFTKNLGSTAEARYADAWTKVKTG